MIGHKSRWLPFVGLLALVLPAVGLGGLPAAAQGNGRTFPETGKTVRGRFLTYWDSHGGLAQQGYPISNEMQEVSATDGRTYTVQYFERAVFELHPELRAPNDVLLSLLGVFLYNEKYPGGAPAQVPATGAGTVLFPETGKRAGGIFLQYWRTHGGLAQQGYPISDQFLETSDLDGQTYLVQYFERAVFEYHPEKLGTGFEVLLSQLGTFEYRARYGAAGGGGPGDSDGDGIADADDRCPGDFENYNGVFDNDGCSDTIQDLIDFAANDINEYWSQVFSDSGIDYYPPEEFLSYTEPIDTACGPAALDNAFYCSESHGIYYDINFLQAQLDTDGDFAPVVILAHEWGHLVQANLGILRGRYLSIETELQADCLAGTWTTHAGEMGYLEEGDLEEGATALFKAGDLDIPWFDPSAHGTPDQRVQAFLDGLQYGVSRCVGQ
jgi:hypothetical protein